MHVVIGEVLCSHPDPAHSGPCTPVRGRVRSEKQDQGRETDMVNLGPLGQDFESAPERYRPRPGDIGITQISDWGGRVIRALQWANGCGFADYEHAFGVTSVDEGGLAQIVEAMPEGAHQVSNWHDPARTRWLICPEEYREAMTAMLRRQATRKVKYSFADYGALGLHRLHIPAPHLRRFIESGGHQICSQLVDYCADKAGWHLFKDNRWPGYVPPCDLNALWLSLPGSERAGR
jgi:hypothetical protein